jgi:hypothetical protein
VLHPEFRTGSITRDFPSTFLLQGTALFRLEMKIILGVTSDVSEEYREEFLETNKKTNYISRQETARQIY